VWLSKPAAADALDPLTFSSEFALWRLAWDAWPTNDAGQSPAPPWWAGKWSLAAGAYYWPQATEIEPRRVTGSSLFPETGLGYAGWIPSLTDPWRCVDTNLVSLVESQDSTFPTVITLEPYWP